MVVYQRVIWNLIKHILPVYIFVNGIQYSILYTYIYTHIYTCAHMFRSPFHTFSIDHFAGHLATGLQMVSGMSCEEYQFLSEAKNNLTAAWRERGSTWQVIESRRFLVV